VAEVVGVFLRREHFKSVEEDLGFLMHRLLVLTTSISGCGHRWPGLSNTIIFACNWHPSRPDAHIAFSRS
jgi:hypothetical protein